MVSIKNLTHRFNDKIIFSNLTHIFPAGIHALVGPSGIGKTTLLRIIAGLQVPTEGNVEANGRVSVSFQDSVLLPWYTAKKNVELVSDKETATTVLSELGLRADLNTLPAKLSGGMKNRVSIARALAYDASIILLDEPFAGLDAETAQNALEVIKKYTKGKTVIISTHNLEIAHKLDSVFELKENCK